MQYSKLLMGAAAAVLGGGIATAHAVEIRTDANSVLGGVEQGPYVDGPAATGFVDILESDNAGINSSFIHSYGNVNGSFGSRTSGMGTDFDVTGSFNYNDAILNDSGIAQNYNFEFTVTAGEVSTGSILNTADWGVGDTMSAGYLLEVFVSIDTGTPIRVWDSAYQIDDSSTGPSQTSSGTDIGGSLSADGRRYSWGSFGDSIDIGPIADGSSFTIDYTLSTFATGMLTNSGSNLCGFGGYEGGGDDEEIDRPQAAFVIDGEGGGSCSVISRIGDPLQGQGGGTPISITASPATTVPEPGSLALVALGALAGMRARRKS